MNQQQHNFYSNSGSGQQQTVFQQQQHAGHLPPTYGVGLSTPSGGSTPGSANRNSLRGSQQDLQGLQILHPGPARVQQQLQLSDPTTQQPPQQSPPCILVPMHQQQQQQQQSFSQESVSPLSSMSHSSVFPAPLQQQQPHHHQQQHQNMMMSENFSTPTGSFCGGQQGGGGMNSSTGSSMHHQPQQGGGGLYSNPLMNGSGSNIRYSGGTGVSSVHRLPNIISPATSVTSWGSTPMGFSSSGAPGSSGVNYGHPSFGSTAVSGYRGPNPQTPIELPTHASVYETKVRMMCDDAATVVAGDLTVDYAASVALNSMIVAPPAPSACVVLNTAPGSLVRKGVSPKNIVKSSVNNTSDNNLTKRSPSALNGQPTTSTSLLTKGGPTSSNTENQEEEEQEQVQQQLQKKKSGTSGGNPNSGSCSPPSTQDLIKEERELLDGFRTKSWACFVAPSSSAATAISLTHYMERLIMQMYSSETCLLLAIVLMRRFCKNVPDFPLTTRTVHRLLLACYVLAAKNHEEKYYGLSYYAKVGGLVVDDLREMELQAFIGVDFNCFVEAEEYRAVLLEMQTQREVVDSSVGGTDMSSIGGGVDDLACTMSVGSESDLCTPGILPLPQFLLNPQQEVPSHQHLDFLQSSSVSASTIYGPPLPPPTGQQVHMGPQCGDSSTTLSSQVPRSAFWDDLLPAMV